MFTFKLVSFSAILATPAKSSDSKVKNESSLYTVVTFFFRLNAYLLGGFGSKSSGIVLQLFWLVR